MTAKNTDNAMLRTLSGTVVSNKMDKTIVVRVDRTKLNKKYKMRYGVAKKFHVHDPLNQFQEGDKVTFAAMRPLSKTKRWRVLGTRETQVENEA
ncbi:MAG TPA: 30S ribosomal protein S17 [Patescibacteria group bacterium]|nr:30S ribosomal protein S17 [Patescibacteria group bacterium]